MRDAAGNLYGTTDAGDANGNGTVFRLAPDGTLTTLHSFRRLTVDARGDKVLNDDGAAPSGALVQGSDGNLYGTTATGGTGGQGTLFVLKFIPAVTLSAPKRVIAEDGSLGTATVFVSRSGGSVDSPLVVSLRFLGTATNGTDYRRVRPTVTIPAGATRASFVVWPLDVGLVEGSRSIHIRVKAAADGSYAVVSGLDKVNRTINENDPVTDPPVLTSSGSVTGDAGVDFSYQITAIDLPGSFTADNLPAGLGFDPASGLISGRVGQTGTYQISISAASFQLTVLPSP